VYVNLSAILCICIYINLYSSIYVNKGARIWEFTHIQQCMQVYIYIHVCTWIHMQTHILCTYNYICLPTLTDVHNYTSVFVFRHVYIYIYIYIYIHMYLSHMCIYMYIYIYTYVFITHVYICNYIFEYVHRYTCKYHEYAQRLWYTCVIACISMYVYTQICGKHVYRTNRCREWFKYRADMARTQKKRGWSSKDCRSTDKDSAQHIDVHGCAHTRHTDEWGR